MLRQACLILRMQLTRLPKTALSARLPNSLPPNPSHPHPSGFVEPGSTYRGDASDAGAQPQLFRATQLNVEHNPEDYEVKQVGGWVMLHDGRLCCAVRLCAASVGCMMWVGATTPRDWWLSIWGDVSHGR